MGAELALSEEVGDLAGRPAAKAASPVAGDSIREVLKRSISLRIPRDTLEAVLAELGKVLGVEIVILGADLQADGVTKNQMLAVDFAERPAEEILVEILRQANPDKSAAGASDPRQKVVYVIGPPSPGKPEAVLITTRPRAAVRGQTLPDAFEPGRTRDAGNPPRSGK
jgi:hypothetical protein